MLRRSLPMGFAVVAGMLGCSSAESTPVDAEPGEEYVHRTVVELTPDGNRIRFDGDVSVSQSLAERLSAHNDRASSEPGIGTARQSITIDSSCAGSSIWIFDQASYGGNEICFYGQGSASLAGYCRSSSPCLYAGSWAEHVRSYWSGADWGMFGNQTPWCCGGACSSFSAYEQNPTVSTCEQLAKYLHLDILCIPCSPEQ